MRRELSIVGRVARQPRRNKSARVATARRSNEWSERVPAPHLTLPHVVVGGSAMVAQMATTKVASRSAPQEAAKPEKSGTFSPTAVFDRIRAEQEQKSTSGNRNGNIIGKKMKTAAPSRKYPKRQQTRIDLTSASARIRGGVSNHIDKMIQDLAEQKPTAVTLSDFHDHGLDSSPDGRLRNAKFLYHELPIRIAQRVVELRSLPHGLSEMRPIIALGDMYRGYLRKLVNAPRPRYATREEDAQFTALLKSIFLEHSSVVQQMALGVIEFREELHAHPTATWDQDIQRDIDAVLNRFYTARIGLRLLVEQHIMSGENRPGFSGVIQSACTPFDLARQAAEDARYLCDRHLGESPQITLHGALDATFTYVPSHIHYCITELLKNSCRATVEHHRANGGDGEIPPVRIVIARGNEDVTIKVSDEGGGIPRSDMEKVWTYLHSSAARPDALSGRNGGQRDSSALAGYGVGMPLSRLYAEYFGGSMEVKSMESLGTDAYLHLNRLGWGCENLPELVLHSPGNLTSTANGDEAGV